MNYENLPEAGIDDIQPNREESIITLWEWESGIPLPTTTTSYYYGRKPSFSNDTTTTRVPE